MFEPTLPDPWSRLRRYTNARIALGRAGGSQPTRDQLAFALDHALARDAVHAPFELDRLAAELRAQNSDALTLTSAACDRATFLQRPDLGRRLSPESLSQLSTLSSQLPSAPDLVVIVSDGLSALAAERQAPPLLSALFPHLRAANLALAPVCLVRHARVALMDEVGSVLRARLALILLGERPGLGTPDSLGAYLEFDPRPGRTNADRNCVSNIRPAGLPPAAAAARLAALLVAARDQQRSGIALKDSGESPAPQLAS
ncbi:MAG TPA: ethanolamine ammonia-lyase subunit EutC [Opitutus sp.]|nr:ethanolamine ammonia-lyase subunit EutC [Opitutus sp.]